MTLRIRAAGLLCALLLTATLPLVACDKTNGNTTEQTTEAIVTEQETEPMTETEQATTEEITTEEVTTEPVIVERGKTYRESKSQSNQRRGYLD